MADREEFPQGHDPKGGKGNEQKECAETALKQLAKRVTRLQEGFDRRRIGVRKVLLPCPTKPRIGGGGAAAISPDSA